MPPAARSAGLRWGGAQRNLSNFTLPRIRLWPSDDELLVFIGIADGNCDPVVGIDLYVTGRLGNWLSGWLWERGRRRSTSHRHLITRHRHPDWHGHCDPERRGYKRCDRQHWHLWWRHDNHATSLPDCAGEPK